ncbi:MAG: OmpH family outer membrane protein [Candidatus Bipolaricaulota bacterium]|nr:OmpH family outer membrane protein [Candidatus Bipolaricaulota bacterium]
MKAQWIVGAVIGALVLGFAGGFVGSRVLPGGNSGDVAKLTERVAKVEAGQRDLETRLAGVTTGGAGLRIGVVDAETLFTRVFLPQVQAERAAMETKAREIQTLQADYAAGKMKQDVYQQRYLRLQAEYIQRALKVNTTMLDKMIASPGFLNLRSDLENVRTQAKPLSDEVEKAVKEAEKVILDPQGFAERLQQLQAAFQQLDQLLTQVAAVKILEISQQIAKEKGYDLVLRTKDVVMFRRESTIIDLSTDVEGRLWALFPSR